MKSAQGHIVRQDKIRGIIYSYSFLDGFSRAARRRGVEMTVCTFQGCVSIDDGRPRVVAQRLLEVGEEVARAALHAPPAVGVDDLVLNVFQRWQRSLGDFFRGVYTGLP